MSFRNGQCEDCKHFVGYIAHPDDPLGVDILPVCEAYPKGVPSTLARDEVRHDEPFPGDNGILFEPSELEKDTRRRSLRS